VWSNLRANLAMTADLAAYEPIEVLLRLQYWGWMAAAGGLLAVRFGRFGASAPAAAPYLIAGVAAMAGAMALLLALYTLTNATEHRVLSAFLLFATVLAVLAPGRAGPVLAGLLILSQLVGTSVFLRAFREERQANFVWDRRGYLELQNALATAGVTFQPGADRWCNTLLTSQFPPFLTVVPPGVGLSVAREPNQLTRPARSRFLLLDDRALADFVRPPRGEPLARLPYGTLYRNLDSDCR
jgi:hypothetical protein